ATWRSPLFSGLQAPGRRAEVFREVGQRAHDRIGRETTQRAERAELHGVAEVFEDREVLGSVLDLLDAIDDLDAPGPSGGAGGALSEGFDRAEFHGEACLLGHIDRIVEYDDAAVPDQAVARRERFIVERRVEQRAREISTERATHLHGAHQASARGAAA